MDVNVRAFRIVQEAVDTDSSVRVKKAASRRGGLKGGPARAESISGERRREISKKANEARWRNHSAEGSK